MNRLVVVLIALLVLAVVSGTLVWLNGYDDGYDDGDVLARWGKGEISKAESDYYDKRVKRIANSWKSAARWTSQWRNRGMVEQPNDVFMVIDVEKPAMWLEYKGKVVEEFYTDLPEGMQWQIHCLTPDGNKRLADAVRLQIRGVYTDKIVAETIYLAGASRDWHMHYQIMASNFGSSKGTGGHMVIPKYQKSKPTDKDPYESIIVDDEEYAGYMAGLKDRDVEGSDEGLVELLFNGSDEYRENLRRWQAVEKRMYAELVRQFSLDGYDIGQMKLQTGPDYLAGHAEVGGRDDGFFRSRSVDVNLNYLYLGEGLWRVFSVPGRFRGIRRDKLALDFMLSEDGEYDVDTAEGLKAEIISVRL